MHNNKNGRGGVQKYEQVSQNDDKTEIIIFQTNKKISEVSFRCFCDKDSFKWLVDISAMSSDSLKSVVQLDTMLGGRSS